MKLIQLNIWGGKLQHQIPKFLSEEEPDIVCMQEVHDLKGPSGAVFVTLDEIKQKCGFAYSYMSPTYSSTYQRRANSFGNAILTNLEIKHSQTVFTYGEYNNDFDLTEDDFNVRNFQHVILSADGSDLNVLNHHGYLLPETKDGNEETLEQMKTIASYVSKLNGPIILAGDFNLAPNSLSIKELEKVLVDLPVKYGVESTYNKFNSNTTVSDYIFVNELVRSQKLEVSEELVSDHKALILEFDI
jgi:endonuclease/exonuclease/phosphatase family metal-dependent hydrolase